jgi:transposase
MNFKKVSTWQEFTNCPAIGVDVCKKYLDLVGLSGSTSFYRRIDNTAQAIGEFAKALGQQEFKGTILCEATSHYHLVLAVMSCEAGLDIRVINPLMSSKHAKSAIRKTKTDRVDAHVLATMVLTEPQPATTTEAEPQSLSGPPYLRPHSFSGTASSRNQKVARQLPGTTQPVEP